MDWQRNGLLAGMLVVALLLFNQWSSFSEANKPAVAAEQLLVPGQVDPLLALDDAQSEGVDIGSDLPVARQPPGLAEIAAPLATSRLVTVESSQFSVVIDSHGGDIVQVKLKEHLDKPAAKNGQPFTLLTRTQNNTYVAKSGLVGINATDTREGRPQFAVSRDAVDVSTGAEQLDLVTRSAGVLITKRFTFTPGSYQIGVEYLIDNPTAQQWSAVFYGQINRDSHKPLVNATGVQPYLGAALRTAEKNYRKVTFGDMEDGKLEESIQGGWVAMLQHYFIGAWVPDQSATNHFSLRKLKGQDLYVMGYTSEPIVVGAGGRGSYQTSFYAGPKDQEALARLAEHLDLTIDYGFLWLLAKPIFTLMQWIHNLVGNWGWSIILLTVVIKLALYPLSAASLRSMAKMRKLQPEMARLKELYGDDRQKMSGELMGLYKKHKVNPAGGCLPVLLQMPVFIALYWVLLESVEIRHSSFIFWLTDLSAKDPYFVLPLIMGASMYFMQRLQPMPPDPMQAKIMKIMPIAFTFFFMLFPAGLVLYWTTNNLLSMAQQIIVNRQIESGKG